MAASRRPWWGPLWVLSLLVALGSADGLTAQSAAPDGLGSARGCTRGRLRVVGTVTPVTAENHTFLGRFVGSFARYVQPRMPRMHGDVQVGLGGPAPVSVSFALKAPVTQPLLPDQTEDRLSLAQHRDLYTSVKSAITEIQDAPSSAMAIALRLEGSC